MFNNLQPSRDHPGNTAMWSQQLQGPKTVSCGLIFQHRLGVLPALRWNDSPDALGYVSSTPSWNAEQPGGKKKRNLLSTRKCIHKCVRACMCLNLGVVRSDSSWVRSFDRLAFPWRFLASDCLNFMPARLQLQHWRHQRTSEHQKSWVSTFLAM